MANSNNWIESIINNAMTPEGYHINVLVDPSHDRLELFSKLQIASVSLGNPTLSYFVPFSLNTKATMNNLYNLPHYQCYILDISPTLRKNQLSDILFLSEQIKHGEFYNTRGRYKSQIRDEPNVWILVRYPIDRELLTAKWKIWTIVNEQLVQDTSEIIPS